MILVNESDQIERPVIGFNRSFILRIGHNSSQLRIRKMSKECQSTVKALSIISFLVVSGFFFSPMIQLNRDIIKPAKMGITGWQYTYPDTIMWLNLAVITLGIIAYLLGCRILFFKRKCLKDIIPIFIPQFLMAGFAGLIIITTVHNGFTNYALYGDKYVHENLLSFMLYTLVYFMFACFIYKAD